MNKRKRDLLAEDPEPTVAELREACERAAVTGYFVGYLAGERGDPRNSVVAIAQCRGDVGAKVRHYLWPDLPIPTSEKKVIQSGWVQCECGSPHPAWWSHGMELADIQKHLTLPRGLRWLRLGERARHGDVIIDPRTDPVTIKSGWVMQKGCHPVRRKKESPRVG